MCSSDLEDIKLIAKYGFLIFADGYTAQIISQKLGEDQHEKPTYDLVLEPTEELIKRYDIQPNKDPRKEMLLEIQIPCDMVIQLNPDPAWTRWFCLKTYDGVITPGVNMLNGTVQQKIIEKIRTELKRCKDELEVVKEERDLLKSNLPKYIEQNAKPFLDIMSPILEKAMAKKPSD